MDLSTLIPLPLAAKTTSLSEPTLRRRLHSGAIQGVRLGRDWYIPNHEVDRISRDFPLVATSDSA